MKVVRIGCKTDIMKNLIYLIYDNLLILSYLFFINEKKEYQNILNNIIDYLKYNNEINYFLY